MGYSTELIREWWQKLLALFDFVGIVLFFFPQIAKTLTDESVARAFGGGGFILCFLAANFSLYTRLRYQTEFHVGETLDFQDVDFDYYPGILDGKPSFGFKVSSRPNSEGTTLRKMLTFRLVNTTDKPIKVKAVQFEKKKGKILPLDPLSSQLSQVIEPFVGEFRVSIIIDQLWALAQISDQRFTSDFSSLFFFDNLTFNLEYVVFEFVDGKLLRHELSTNMLGVLKEGFNPIPLVRQLPTSETRCSVRGCSNRPYYIVLLYDLYNDGTVFFEQDFTCPFLCVAHMQENERGIGNKGSGERRYPGSMNVYPYSNQGGTTGYTKYMPIDAKTISTIKQLPTE